MSLERIQRQASKRKRKLAPTTTSRMLGFAREQSIPCILADYARLSPATSVPNVSGAAQRLPHCATGLFVEMLNWFLEAAKG